MEGLLLKNPGVFSNILNLVLNYGSSSVMILLEVKKQSLPPATLTRDLSLSSPNTVLCVVAEDRVSFEA